MNSNASATVEGFVTHDPVVKKTKTGKDLCTFSIAIRHYAASGVESKVSFLDVETWEKLALFCGENIRKGKRIIVMGALRQERWQGTDGKELAKIVIVGNKIRLITSTSNDKEEEAQPKAS